jgi:hypothetical protein
MSQTRPRYGTRLAPVCSQLPTSPVTFHRLFQHTPTDHPHHTMAPRPGPLRDLPLEKFIDIPFTPTPTTPRRAHKRPLSPGTPNLFSPTKRRILAQEGVFSPEKTIKSFIVPSDRASVIRDVLRQNPARRLDFGQLPPSDSKVVSNSPLLEDCFMETTPEHSHSIGQRDHDHSSIPMFTAYPSKLLSIPSSSSNSRTNTHHPGFDVWVDRDPTPSLLPSNFSLDNSHASDEDKENLQDHKENVHPKTKWRTGLSKRMQRVSFASPERLRRPIPTKIPFTPLNARNSLEARLRREMTPGRVPKLDRDEVQRRRELLTMELDGDESSDDEL